jgi:hypothetical protein
MSEGEEQYSDISWDFDRTPNFSLMDYTDLLTLINNNSQISEEVEENDITNDVYSRRYFHNDFEDYDYTVIKTVITKIEILQIIEGTLEITKDEMDCCVCLENYDTSQTEICELECKHKFCCKCIKKILKNNKKHNCPLCRKVTNKIIVQTKEHKESMEKIIL